MGYTRSDLITLMRRTLDEPSEDLYSNTELGGWIDIGATATSTWALTQQTVGRVEVGAWGGAHNAAIIDLTSEFPLFNVIKILFVLFDTTATEETAILYPGGDEILLPGGDSFVIGWRADARRGLLRQNHGVMAWHLSGVAYYSHFGNSLWIYPAPLDYGVLSIGMAIHTSDVTHLPDEAQYAAFLYAMHLAWAKDQQVRKAAYMFFLFVEAAKYLRTLYAIDQPNMRQEMHL